MKDSKTRGATGSKAARAKEMISLAKEVKRNPKNRFAVEQLQLMKSGSSFKRSERIVQGRAEAAMDAEAKRRNSAKKKRKM